MKRRITKPNNLLILNFLKHKLNRNLGHLKHYEVPRKSQHNTNWVHKNSIEFYLRRKYFCDIFWRSTFTVTLYDAFGDGSRMVLSIAFIIRAIISRFKRYSVFLFGEQTCCYVCLRGFRSQITLSVVSDSITSKDKSSYSVLRLIKVTLGNLRLIRQPSRRCYLFHKHCNVFGVCTWSNCSVCRCAPYKSQKMI